MTKLIYLGCLSSTKYKETCENAKRIINILDKEYKVIDGAPCCGSLLHHTSNAEELQNHVQHVYDWLNSNNVTDILTICAGCYNYLTSEYPKYLTDFNINVKHFVQFINQSENLHKLKLNYSGNKLVVTYHDACHLKNALPEIIEEPRNIINSIEGNVILKDMENNRKSAICCGSGGGVYSSFKENSDFNSTLIFEQAKKQRAKLVLTACPFCFTALDRIKEENKKIRISVLKFEDFLNKIIEQVELP